MLSPVKQARGRGGDEDLATETYNMTDVLYEDISDENN